MSRKRLNELLPRDKVYVTLDDGSIKTQGAWTSLPKIYTIRFVYQDSLVLYDSDIVFSNKTGLANTSIVDREWFGCKLVPLELNIMINGDITDKNSQQESSNT